MTPPTWLQLYLLAGLSIAALIVSGRDFPTRTIFFWDGHVDSTFGDARKIGVMMAAIALGAALWLPIVAVATLAILAGLALGSLRGRK